VSAVEWVTAKDPGLLAAKRSLRAAVVMPFVFGLTHLLFSNPQVSLFGAFGSFALLLLVDPPGRPRIRLASYLTLFLVGTGFIALGTSVSTYKVVAIVTMGIVGFGVLFAGIVSPQAATSSTAALLMFVLPVTVTQPAAATGPRLVGWIIASAFCIPACMLVWPTPWHDKLRHRLSATAGAVSRLATSIATGGSDREAKESVASELSLLQAEFAGTPYPPTGAAGGAVALAKLVGRLEWVASSTILVSEGTAPSPQQPAEDLIGHVADSLHLSASLICGPNARPLDDTALIRSVQQSNRRLDRLIEADLEAEVSRLSRPGPDAGPADVDPVPATVEVPAEPGGRGPDQGIASALDPSLRIRALGIATEMVADATLEAVGAQAVGDRRLGAGTDIHPRPFWRRLSSQLSLHSVWFRNAVRGSVGLALAVAVVEITDVEHGFWVVLGTLSVLRSNALGTGATAVRAVGGTAVGFAVGSAIMVGVAGHSVLLWALLPLAVLVSGVAPSVVSFAAGQAGFTLVVIILFNIIEPTGWRVGLTRIEDVAIGCGVSVVVGLLLWPRGATAALGRALSDAFVQSSGYLAEAVARLTTTTHEVDTGPAHRASHRAYLRLDDAFREFLAERGAKVVPVETAARLFSGSNRIRLAAYTLATLPVPASESIGPEIESVAIAGAVLRDAYAERHRWYEEFADVLGNRRPSLDAPPAHDQMLHSVLQAAFEDARTGRRPDQLRTTMRMLWADELLESQQQMQTDLAGSATLFAGTGTAMLAP
jgi:uncharacterized membrane protein YccC